jgi:glutathione S-transferase
MHPITLVIGNKNYSSWSLRPWLLLQAGIAFERVRIPLYSPGSEAEQAKWLPSSKVPALHDSDVRVCDLRISQRKSSSAA